MKKIIVAISVLVLVLLALFGLFNSNYKDIFYSNSVNLETIQVDSTAIRDIKSNLSIITKYCDYYDVSPKAVIGIIAAERSLHTGPINFFEEYYVKNTFLSQSENYLKQLAEATRRGVEEKKINGESDQEFGFRLRHGLIWTIGLCQISIMKGIEIDSAIAIAEKKYPMEIKKIIESLLNPDSNIKYCVFELKKIQMEFKQQANLDISNDIGILCTLYNRGKLEESIHKYNQTKKRPQKNLFGKFAEQKMDTLLSVLEITPN